MEQPAAPSAAAPMLDDAALNAPPAAGSPTPLDSVDTDGRRKKVARKKRKVVPPGAERDDDQASRSSKQTKKPKKRKDGKKDEDGARKKARTKSRNRPLAAGAPPLTDHLSAAQMAVNEQMRRALEDDKYSAVGSIVDTDSDEDDTQYPVHGGIMRIDRSTIMNAMKKGLWLERIPVSEATVPEEEHDYDSTVRLTKKQTKRKRSRRSREDESGDGDLGKAGSDHGSRRDDLSASVMSGDQADPADFEPDGGSIFGQTTGASNATWVECDKCKKWRRLRGVVDEKKLPTKWYCSMNKNDPERSRCSAPEEQYETQNTPESAADARTRKHLRIWVRRLQANEAYESRQPTMTRGKKRSAATSSKEPYEWIRCCNPSCGKWRAILRFMDAKNHVIDRTNNGEWYCVMNTWDEKTASCAAPQENLPAIGCPPWVMQDDN